MNPKLESQPLSLAQYQKLALSTKAPTNFLLEDAIHAGYGMITETAEIMDNYKKHIYYKKPLDVVNLVEELGDLLWYVALGAYSLELTLQAPKENNDLPKGFSLNNHADIGKILGTLIESSTDFYIECIHSRGEEYIDYRLDFEISRLVQNIDLMAKICYSDIITVAEMNIEKLRKRYPKGFSENSALVRNTTNELSHIVEETKTLL